MENSQGNFLVVILGLVISLLGNVMQYFMAPKKRREDVSQTVAETAKNIAEAYTMTLHSLQERIVTLEEEREKDTILIKSLQERIKQQEEEIENLKKILEKLTENK